MGKQVFKTLTDEDKEYIALIRKAKMGHAEKTKILSKKYGVTRRTIRSWWDKLGLSNLNSGLPHQLRAARGRLLDGDEDVLLVTAIQNKSLINEEMWENLLAYKKFIEESFGKKVKIIVIPSRYRNPISVAGIENYRPEEWWAREVNEYLYYYKVEFGNTMIAADTRIRPTAVNPLSGFEPLAGDGHLVVGHPRHHLKPLPRFKGETLKTMSTTGFLSRSNYSISKSGDKAQIHHSYGFVVIEKADDDECLIPRKVKVNGDGEFTDICWNVKDGKVSQIKSSRAMVLGDIHKIKLDPKKDELSFELASLLSPESIVVHDLADGNSFNPHERKDMFILRHKIRNNEHLIENEINDALDYPQKFVDAGYKVKVIESNHDHFLDRHINDSNWKKDLHNSPAFLKYALIQQTVDLMEHGSIFGYLISERYDSEDVEYIKYTDPLRICGYLNFHGEYGSNGSRGSGVTFRKLNTKIIHAHVHSPYMLDNVTAVGTSSHIWQYFNSKGASSWAHSDSVIHDHGKNQLFIYTDDYELSRLLPNFVL